ncbi:MAG TPA: DUF4229 domain-containing protein [Actinomycetes bacterium]|nr:DUF4229 domain-containing protein [Actinomycetes bacterium]
MRQFWTYTLARLGLVAVVAGLLWLVGLRGPVLLVLAFVVSGLVSYVILRRQRGALAETVDARARRIRERMAEAEAAEDAADEAMRTQRPPAEGGPQPGVSR